MSNRTYVSLVLLLFAFISFYLSMWIAGVHVVSFAVATLVFAGPLLLTRPIGRFTRAVSIALCIAAFARLTSCFINT